MFPTGENDLMGNYRIVRKLGAGQSTEVLLATATGPCALERAVVIKRLVASCAWEPSEREALMTEALACSRLTHPAIVHVYDFFSVGGNLALVLEYVDGPSLTRLRALLRAHSMTLGDAPALFLAYRVFAALAAAHSARDPRSGDWAPVVHRDVNPSNVLIPWDGFAKLGDFGLAKILGVSENTRAGLLKGTYGYMAPEQVLGERVTPRTDVYLGCLLLRELLLGRSAFLERDLPELEYLTLMANARLAPLEELRGGISPALADALRRGLAPDPANRTVSPQEMVQVLRDETDMDAAHEALVGLLKIVRPRPHADSVTQPNVSVPLGLLAAASASDDTEEYTSPLSSDRRGADSGRTSLSDMRSTMTLPFARANVRSEPPPSRGTGRYDLGPPHRDRVNRVALAAALTLTAGIGALVHLHASTPVGERSGTRPTEDSLESPPGSRGLVPLASSHRAAVRAPHRAPTPPSTTGEIMTPATLRPHRVFVDGQIAAPSSGGAVQVPCGEHVVRIGSGGATQVVDVPCGGSVTVAP